MPELLTSMTVFSMLSIALFWALKSGTDAFRRIEAQYDTQRSLRQAETALMADLKQTNASDVRFKKLAAPGNGDVLWFPSAIDPTAIGPNVQRLVRDPSAEPVWQRTIIYYLIRPSNHNVLAGYACGNDANPNGDAYCPHKFLVRKVVNQPATPEPLMSSGAVDAYTNAPAGFDISSFIGEPGLEEAKIISDRLLWFEVNRPAGSRMITLDLRGFRLRDAQKSVSVGTLSLVTDRFTVYHQLRVVPQNQ